MVTQKELETYRQDDSRPFLERAGLSSATAWLLFYALAIVGGILANAGKAVEVGTVALH
jgi:hypothetical protein